MVRYKLKFGERVPAEVFLEWAEDNPDEIATMRGRSEAKREKAFSRLHDHCARIADKARKSLASQNFETFATFDPLISEELEECRERTGLEGYDPKSLEMLIREEETGAPF